MSTREPNEYRLVLDDFTDKPYGVVKIVGAKCNGNHWIKDSTGKFRHAYRFKRIDEVTYETVVAFGTHIIMEPHYRRLEQWFGYAGEFIWMFVLGGVIFTTLAGIVLVNTIQFGGLAPTMQTSGWFQIAYWLVMVSSVLAPVLAFAAMFCHERTTGNTSRDEHIAKWKKFQQESIEESEDEEER